MFSLKKGLKGRCNLCGEYSVLTKDHVPPKGAIRITQMMSLDLVETLDMAKPQRIRKGKISQNGVKFATLCGQCNNSILGRDLDPAFNNFVKSVYDLVHSKISLPLFIPVKCQPGKVARAFLGHMAATTSFDGAELLREDLGEFIREGKELPSDANIYCWPFPYKNQALVPFHCIAPEMAKTGYKGTLITWVMKFAPVAFMLCWKQPTHFKLTKLTSISDYITGSENNVEILFKLSKVEQYWPERPGPNDVILRSSTIRGINSFAYRNSIQLKNDSIHNERSSDQE